jgi:hypothetical protein
MVSGAVTQRKPESAESPARGSRDVGDPGSRALYEVINSRNYVYHKLCTEYNCNLHPGPPNPEKN